MSAILGSLLLLLIGGPLLRLLFAASPKTFGEAFSDTEVLRAIGLSMLTASIATGIALVLGVPLAYALARVAFPGRAAVRWLVDLPVVVPHPVAGMALILFLGRQSTLGGWLARVGLEIVNQVPGIVAGMLFVSAPLLVSAAREAFGSVDPKLERVARTLGDSGPDAFRRVTVPLAARGILAGAVLAWARALSEFGSIVLVTYNPKVASVLIFDRYTLYGLPAAIPGAVLLLAVALLVFAVVRLLQPTR